MSFDRLAMLEALFDDARRAVIVLTPAGHVLDANVAAEPWFGTTVAEARGTKCWQTPAWERASSLVSWLRTAIVEVETGAPHRQRHRLAGTNDVYELTLRRIDRAGTAGTLLQLTCENVTAQVEAEHDVQDRSTRLRMLAEHMHDLLFILRVEPDGGFRCESVNSTYLHVTGLREEQVVGQRLEDVLPPAEAAIAREHYREAMSSNQSITYREEAKLGEKRLVVQTTLTAVRDATGRVTHLMGLSRDVSEVEQTLHALRESEARFRAALDAGHDAFVIARAVRDASGAIVDFVVVDANARASAIVSATVPALVGQPLLAAFPLSRESGLWEQCCRVVATQKPFEMAQAAPSPTSPGRWVQRQIVPIGDGVAISSRDVTARRREQEALEASEARHRQLFESSGAIQLIVDETRGAIIDVNPAAEAFYGWPRATMRAMLLMDIDASATSAPHAYGDRAIGIAPKKPETRVHRIASGEPRDVEFASSPVVIDGRLARHLIIHDVSDRVRAERELRESEARFRAVIDEMSEGVVLHDASGAIRVFNPSAERILGLSGAVLQGLEPIAHDWHAVHEDGTPWPVTEHPASVALRTGRSQARRIMGIMRGTREHAWLQVTADPLFRANEEKPYAAVAVFSDITSQRVAEERLRAAQKLEAVGQLAGGIAHDFNNLLTVIRGASGFLRESVASSGSALEDVRAIERATERAEELTRRLLAVGRRQLLRSESVDLTALVHEQVAQLRAELPESIELQVETRADAVFARLDREQLVHALRIVVENARGAMSDSGTLTIGTSVRTVDRAPSGGAATGPQTYAVLEVSDTGEGMTEEVRARVFEPFFSTHPFGTNRGIDLASVHGMMVQSQGFIECDSTPGRGTTFRLYFPRGSRPERVATPTSSVSAVDARGILVVDDDPMVRELARRMIERLGHSLTLAASGEEAVQLLATRASNITMLVTDLTMPGMSGLELIAHVEQTYPEMPIVAVSGFAMNPSVRDELDARRIPFVGKPFTADELASAIDRASTSKARAQSQR